jgi:TonB family protein
MRILSGFFTLAVLAAVSTGPAAAQRPRTVSPDSPEQQTAAQREVAPAPQTVRAKYEGGVFGYNKKEDGTLSFDDVNKRLVFRDKLNKERISLPYTSITAAYGDNKSLRPAAASVISAIPTLYTFPAQFIKKKYQYLTLQFSDPDNGVSGITSFKLENKQVMASELIAVAEKSGLSPRGDGFIRKKDSTAMATISIPADPQETVSAGILNAKAVAMPKPDYPTAARDAHAAGTVSVQVTVDEQGNVIDAKAVNGEPALQDAAVAAARKAKFPPTTVNGRPVKVIGVLNYDFEL